MSCQICWDDLDNNLEQTNEYITCLEKSCNCLVCWECMNRLLDFCKQEEENPHCSSCHNEFLLDSFLTPSTNNKELLDKYIDQLADRIGQKIDIEKERKNTQNKFIEKIREEKKVFLEQSFPVAINYVIQIAMQKDLRKLKKAQVQKVESFVKGKRKCFHLLCDGKLDLKMHCDGCDNIFCADCEKQITTQVKEHVCNQEELESVKEIAKLVRCPKCSIPAVKSYGCCFLTCPICSTNFHEKTGEKTSSGNHHDLQIKLKTHNQPSRIFADQYPPEIIQWFIKIEESKPNVSFAEDVTIFDTTNKSKSPLQICKQYQKWRKEQKKMKLYQKKLMTIESLHNERKMNVEQLEKLYSLQL